MSTQMNTPRRSTPAALAALIASVLLLTGCIQLPEAGPVIETETQSGVEDDPAMSIDALPPRRDASPLEIADGFLNAMAGWPTQTNVAKEFLAADAQASWDPRASTTTYVTADPPQEAGSTVTVELTEPELIDGRGAWQGVLPAGQEVLDFDMVFEDGQYRIANPPPGLVVPASWFEPRFRQLALYFYDRSARILVPEPVFVPRGEQLVSTLVEGLLAGPPEGVSQTALPTGLVLDLSSVPVSDDGVADISLSGEVGPLSTQATELIMAQMGWTLRQEPSIRSVRLTIGGQELRMPDGDTEFRVGTGGQYDPTGFQSNPLLYGLSDGRLASGTDARLSTVSGPFGLQDFGLRSVAVNLSATTAAAISGDGRSVLIASVAAEPGEDGPGGVDQVVSGATDLLTPAWDVTDRLWLVDRTDAGARVSYREGGGRLRILDVPGITASNVTAFLVSRDATRLVAVVRTGGVDELRVARIQAGANGRVLRAGVSEAIPLDDGRELRVRDIAWTSTTTIALLSPIVRDVSEVRTVAVDGAPTGLGSLATTVSGRVTGLAGTPVSGGIPYAVTSTGLVDLTTQAGQAYDGAVTTVDYVG
ncbi:MAG: LpqB family beta-propeller domain-containing protein [Nocardioides sp.]